MNPSPFTRFAFLRPWLIWTAGFVAFPIAGLVLGAAQTLALPARTKYRWPWAAAVPVLWALGWTLTTLAGIDVDKQYTVFGTAGAVTFAALSGVLLHLLVPGRSATAGAGERRPHPRIESTA